MNISEAEKKSELVTAPIKIHSKPENKFLGYLSEIETLNADDNNKRSTVGHFTYMDANFDFPGKGETPEVSVYLPGGLEWQLAQILKKLDEGATSPLVLITYKGMDDNVKTDYGVTSVHRFEVRLVENAK